MKVFAMFLLFCSFALSCQKEKETGLRCGPGTHEENGVCVANTQLPEVIAPSTPKVQPTKESLLEKFESELFSYGTCDLNKVNSAPTTCALGTGEGYKKISEGIYKSKKKPVGFHTVLWYEFSITDIQIEESDLENYPYTGIVTFKIETHRTVTDIYNKTHHEKGTIGKGAAKYLFGAKTNRWKRAESSKEE